MALNLRSKFEAGGVSVVWEIGITLTPTSHSRNGTYLFCYDIHL